MIREEDPAGAASRALFEEYMRLVGERLGDEFSPSPEIFATESAFDGPGTAWVVLYHDGVPVGCGGLRPIDSRTGEIKRMFVTAAARGRGHGRTLLTDLERRAREAGTCARRAVCTRRPATGASTCHRSPAGPRTSGSRSGCEAALERSLDSKVRDRRPLAVPPPPSPHVRGRRGTGACRPHPAQRR